MIRRVVVVALLAAAAWLGCVLPASAHPLGNVSVNIYNGIVVAADQVRVEHIVDLAEVPTVQAMPELDVDNSNAASASELSAFAKQRCGSATEDLTLTVGGAPTSLAVISSRATTSTGQAGLDTLRIECSLSAPAQVTAAMPLRFRDGSSPADIGWREVTLQGDEVTLTGSDVPEASVSGELTAYPQSQIDSPLRVMSASASLSPEAPLCARFKKQA